MRHICQISVNSTRIGLQKCSPAALHRTGRISGIATEETFIRTFAPFEITAAIKGDEGLTVLECSHWAIGQRRLCFNFAFVASLTSGVAHDCIQVLDSVRASPARAQTLGCRF